MRKSLLCFLFCLAVSTAYAQYGQTFKIRESAVGLQTTFDYTLYNDASKDSLLEFTPSLSYGVGVQYVNKVQNNLMVEVGVGLISKNFTFNYNRIEIGNNFQEAYTEKTSQLFADLNILVDYNWYYDRNLSLRPAFGMAIGMPFPSKLDEQYGNFSISPVLGFGIWYIRSGFAIVTRPYAKFEIARLHQQFVESDVYPFQLGVTIGFLFVDP